MPDSDLYLQSDEYREGRDAGLDKYTADDNPYEIGTYQYDDWEEGRLSAF